MDTDRLRDTAKEAFRKEKILINLGQKHDLTGLDVLEILEKEFSKNELIHMYLSKHMQVQELLHLTQESLKIAKSLHERLYQDSKTKPKNRDGVEVA